MYTVLIADDEPIVRKGLVSFIDWSSLECQVIYEASNGIEAMNKIREILPDIIVADIKMPGISGLELAEKVHKDFSLSKIIILTGYTDFSYAQSAIRYGVVDFIVKTSAIENIGCAVEKAKELICKERETAMKIKKLETMLNEKQIFLENKFINNNCKSSSTINQSNYIIKKVNDYIAKNYNNKISLKSTANYIHINSSYLSRLYKKETGETLTDSINKLKIEHAKELLETTDMKTIKISQSIGIDDPAYFSHLFKKYVGTSPIEYRTLILKRPTSEI